MVVESPAKARTIGQFLGGGDRVMATRGHVRDLPAKAGSVKPEEGFAMVYETGKGAARTLGAMAKALCRADALVLATDPDREGEAIAWQVLSWLREQDAVGDRAVHRVVFHEVTPAAVRTALARPRDIDMDLVEAWQARRALDYLVGYGLSPVLWRKLPGCRSAGRVQSVALRLICEREAEIEAFAPRAYWTVAAEATATDGGTLRSGGTHGSGGTSGSGAPFRAELCRLDGAAIDAAGLAAGAVAEAAAGRIQRARFAVAAVEHDMLRREPVPPFTTSTLQQEAALKLGFGIGETMEIAQRLYEGVDLGDETAGLITYMRTDSTAMAKTAVAHAQAVVRARFGGDCVPAKPRVFRTRRGDAPGDGETTRGEGTVRRAQEAHEAIRPTDFSRTPEDVERRLDKGSPRHGGRSRSGGTSLTRAEVALYGLIWRRAVASQMTAARFERVRVELASEAGDIVLAARGYLHISQNSSAVGKNKRPLYIRQDSPTTLVFGRTVLATGRDTDGVCLGSSCRDDTIEGVNKFRSSIDNAISGEDRLSFDRHSTSYRVDGRSTGLTGGVCDRTWGVRNRLVTLVGDADDCSEVTNQQLAGLSSLFVDGSGNTGPVASVAKRDFAGLDALTTLSLTNHDITGLADNVFDHIEDTLTRLRLEDNAIRRATGDALKDMANLDIVEMADSGLSHIEAGFFGTANLTQLELQGNDLTALTGIGKVRAKRITDAWAEQKVIREIMVFLHSHGVGTARAVRIFRTYGADAVEVMTENPYRLARDIRGIGFVTADAIAMKLGIEKTAMVRVRAGIGYALTEAMDEGHCGLPEEELGPLAAKLLEVPGELIRAALDLELSEGTVVADTVVEIPCIFLGGLHRAERAIAGRLLGIAAGNLPWPDIDSDKALPWVEGKTGLALAPGQADAVRAALSSKVSVITGGPGVGKTTIVNSILRILSAKGVDILLCAPTGRAAKRMSEATGLEAKTIHRLLEVDPSNGGFRRDAHNPLHCGLLVIDETSMVDVMLMRALLAAIPDEAALLIVGDVDQLPSVGPGQVLADIIASSAVPVVRLTEVFRQAARSRIVTTAHGINRGAFPDLSRPEGDSDFYFVPADDPETAAARIVELVKTRIPQRFGFHAMQDIQVLCPMNRGGAGARSLNIELQAALNPAGERKVERFGWTFAPGDKVMQIENDYDKEAYNGDIGLVADVDPDAGELTARFEGRDLLYGFGELDTLVPAYAATVHKSQGSEYPAVVIPVLTQHYAMLRRNLLYTGVTRGKRLVVLVGQKKAVAIAVRNASGRRRWSKLDEWLAGAEDRRGYGNAEGARSPQGSPLTGAMPYG